MAAGRMHADEAEIDAALVGRLLAAQFPRWAHLPIRAVASAGTDNAIFRIGKEMCVRLPRIQAAAGQVEKEQRWLPRLAPLLPLAIPIPLAKGEPGEGYPWHWSVYEWLPGETATLERLATPRDAAAHLAGFVGAMQRVDPDGGPPPGDHNFFRGVPLTMRDARTREAIASLGGEFDSDALTAAWESALAAPPWPGPPAWIHGDLQSGNLLAVDGQLSGVIDFGCLGVGDPACDLQVAWNFFAGDSRQAFHATLQVDDAPWARGRGWALSVALIQIPYYRDTNPTLTATARYTIGEVLAEFKSGG